MILKAWPVFTNRPHATHAFAQALGDKQGIARYGSAYVPMDETLARAVVDFSGRPFLDFRAPEGIASMGAFSYVI